MPVVPGVVGQNSPTVQHGLVPFGAGKKPFTLGFVDGVAALACIVAAVGAVSLALDATAQIACTVAAIGTFALPVGGTAQLACTVSGTASLSEAPSGAADVGVLPVSATVKLNAQEVRNA